MVYVTSQPILPRLIDYHYGLVPELDTPAAPIPHLSGSGRRAAAGASSRTRGSRTRAATRWRASGTFSPRSASFRSGRPGLRTAVLKLDRGISGLGNALVDLDVALDSGALTPALELEDTEARVGDYLHALCHQGGIVEERDASTPHLMGAT